MKKINVIIALFCVSTLLMAQNNKLSNFTKSLLETRKEMDSTGQRQSFQKHYALKLSQSNIEYVSAYLHLANKPSDLNFLNDYGVIVNNVFDSILTVEIPIDQLELLATSNHVKFIEAGTPVKLKMAKARVAANVDDVQAGTGLSAPFLGTDVVVGVIDGGFQYNHVNFYRTGDQTDLRVKRVWKQSSNTKYTTQSTIEGAKYDDSTDDTGHATHVTGIAAGGYTTNSYYGVATDADIVMVSMGYTTTDITNGISYVYDYATSVNKPAVVNMSLGMHVGPHDGTSTFDITCDALQGAGRLLVGAAGNEGESKLYIENNLTAEGSAINYIAFDEDYYSASSAGSYVDIWGDNGQNYTIQIVFANTAGTVLYQSTAYSATSSSSQTVSQSTYASGTISIETAKSTLSSNNKGNAYLLFKNFTIKSGYKVGIKITATTDGTVRSWGEDYAISWVNGSTNSTVGEIGGTGNKIISVGAYTTTARYSGSTVNRIASFSSKGPTADGRMKPDITAPGDAIVSSLPNTSAVVNSNYSDILSSATKTINSVKYYWGYMSGTSMATPFVTGVLATWLQANPQLTPSDVRTIFSETAITDTYTGTCPNNTWGYGKIDAYAGLVKVLETTPVKNLENMPDAIMAYPNPNDGSFKVLFTEADADLMIRVYAMNGQQIYVQQVGSINQQESLNIDLGNVSNGAYVVKVTGNKISETFRLLVRK